MSHGRVPGFFLVPSREVRDLPEPRPPLFSRPCGRQLPPRSPSFLRALRRTRLVRSRTPLEEVSGPRIQQLFLSPSQSEDRRISATPLFFPSTRKRFDVLPVGQPAAFVQSVFDCPSFDRSDFPFFQAGMRSRPLFFFPPVHLLDKQVQFSLSASAPFPPKEAISRSSTAR